MATETEMRMVFFKCIADEEFRDAFLDNPKKAASSMGIEVTDDQLIKIVRLIEKERTRLREYRTDEPKQQVDLW